jgi:biotin carboxylase
MKKAVVMIGGGIQQVPAIQRIKDLGYTAIVTDKNKDAHCFPYADVAVNIDAGNIDGLVSWLLENRTKYNISGVFTTINRAVAVAQVGNATGLPSVPAKVASTCDNKLFLKRELNRLGIPNSGFYEIKSVEDAEDLFKKNGGESFFLKAVDGFGGRGIKKITSLRSIKDSFNEIKNISGFPNLIMEEALEGEFIDAQGFFYKGKFYKGGIVDSFFSNEQKEFASFNPVETFNVCPSQKSKKICDDVYDLLEKTAKNLGINWGPVGGDFILTRKGLKVLEITPRLHGPNGTLQIIPAATGIKPFEFMLQCVAGDEPDIGLLEPKFNKVALCKVFVSEKETIKDISFTSRPEDLNGLFKWFIYWQKGQKAVTSKALLAGLATVYVLGNDYKDAIYNLNKVEESFKIT